MDASYKIQRGIHVHLIQFFMCPEFWVHISRPLRFLANRGCLDIRCAREARWTVPSVSAAPPQKWWPEDRSRGPIVAELGVAAALNLHSVFRVADVILHTLVEGTVL